MGRSKSYWIMTLFGAVGAVSGIIMMRSSNVALQTPGKVLGWVGIALLVIARVFFGRVQQPKPPAPKSDLKIS